MAGIFASVDSDISKLKQLKSEIEGIKKALKGINVKVDIDIAKGMESQLKSLTTQYDALVQKVSEAERKIIASVNQINSASGKIIKAQEQLAQAAGSVNGQSTTSKSNNAATQAETASLEAQAKAYSELEKEINTILGTREANIKKLVEEQNAIRLIKAELKELTSKQDYGLPSVQKRMEELNASLLEHKTRLSDIQQVLKNEEKLYQASANSMKRLSQEVSRMKIAYKAMGDEQKASPFGQQLLASIQQADAKIKELDASIGNHQRNVGNYASGWNGLNMSIQQIGRELPSLAVGWNTFFLADEIKRARTEYEAFKKAGLSATPVWKQVVSSLVSWQTVLTVGITLLTLYGGKLVEWASGLFSAKKALSETFEATEEFQKSVGESSAKMVTTIEKLSAGWQKLGGDIEAQKKYILENKEAFDSTGMAINSVADAENLLVKNKDAFVDAINEKCKAMAIMELASKEYEKYIQKAADSLLSLQQQNQQAELDLMEEGTEKKLAQIDAEYDKRKAEIEKKARELAETNKKAGVKGTNASGLTSVQQAEIDRAYGLNSANKSRQVQEAYKAEAEAMRAYLEEYGSYQQKKLAIAEEYAEKIRKAQTEGERLSLEKQRDNAVQQVEIDAIKQAIDWGSVFSGFGVMFKEQLQPTIDRLEEIASDESFLSSVLGILDLHAAFRQGRKTLSRPLSTSRAGKDSMNGKPYSTVFYTPFLVFHRGGLGWGLETGWKHFPK